MTTYVAPCEMVRACLEHHYALRESEDDRLWCPKGHEITDGRWKVMRADRARPYHGGRKRRKMPETSEMRKRYEFGETLAEIAESCGVLASTIRRALLRDGVTLRVPGVRPATKCRYDGCTRPVKRHRHTVNASVSGTTCAIHRAQEARHAYRRRNEVTPERWRIAA